MKTLTVLLDSDDLAGVEVGCPEALRGELLVFDPDLHVLLRQRGLRHLTPWDLVAPGDWPALRALVESAWSFWRASAHAEYRDFDLLQMTPFRHRETLVRFCWIDCVFRRALAELRPAEVVVFAERSGHGLAQPPAVRKYPPLHALARGLAEQAGVATRVLSREALGLGQQFRDLAAQGSDATDLPPASPQQVLADRPYVLLYGNHVDVVNQLPLIRALQQRNACAVVQLYKSADERALSALRAAGHILWHESQLAGDRPLPAEIPGARAARQAFDHARQQAPPELRGIFANPCLDIHFDFIFDAYLRKLAWHVDVWSRFFEEHRPVVLVLTDRVPLADVAVRRGVPCLTLPHDLRVGGTHRIKTLLPRIGALSELHRQTLLAAGLAERDVCVTGSPALDPLVVLTPEARRAFAAGARRDVRRRLRIDPHRALVLFCTVTPGLLSKYSEVPEADWRKAAALVAELGELAARRAQWSFVFKCHPRYDHPHWYADLNRRLPADRQVRVMSDGSVAELSAAADVIVFPQLPTSAVVEASFWGRPVLVVTATWVLPDSDPWHVRAWPTVGSVAELEVELAALLADREHYARRAAQTAAALAGYLGDPPPCCMARCVELVEQALGADARSRRVQPACGAGR